MNMTLLFTLGLFFVLLLLLCKFYLNYKKKFAGFPFLNLWSYFLHCQVTGKITKDTPLNHVFFEKLIQTGKQYIDEGHFMTFVLRPMLVIYNQEEINFFINEKAAQDKPPEYKLLEEIIGPGIGTSNGVRWRSHRRLMNPAFNLGILAMKIPIFNENAMALVKDIEKFVGRPSVDILETLKHSYFSSLCEIIMDLKQTENRAEILKLAKFVDNLTEMTIKRAFKPWLIPKFTFRLFPSGRKYYYQLKACDDFILQLIEKMKNSLSPNKDKDAKEFGNSSSKSLTHILLKQHLNDPSFTIDDVHAEVKTLISAGYDTVSYTTMWCLFLLGLHPEVQEKAFTEIESKTSDYITPEECNDLAYLEAIVKETLRLYATVPVYLRNLTEDVQYKKYNVAKGTTIAFFVYISHRNPKLYPDPEEFKPERFLNEDLKTTNSFVPFAEGNRTCIGKNYAMMEMKIFLAHMLRNFKFISLDKREDIRLCWTCVTSPAKPLQMQIMQRSS